MPKAKSKAAPKAKTKVDPSAPVYGLLLQAATQPRPIIRMQPFESPVPALWEGEWTPEQHAAHKEYADQWLAELLERIRAATGKIADEVGADPAEIFKVWHRLVELKPPETRGRPKLHDLASICRAEKNKADLGTNPSKEVLSGLDGISRGKLGQAEADHRWFAEVCRDSIAYRTERGLPLIEPDDRPAPKK